MALNFDAKMGHYKIIHKRTWDWFSFDLHSLVLQLFAKVNET
jgi:hypothetical protein